MFPNSNSVAIVSGLILNNTYRLEKLLGKGGMGEVWMASHLLLNEPRAIKLMLTSVTNQTELQNRFIFGEAKNSLRLLHPHIVRVHDLNLDYSFPYIVMEYITGSAYGADLRQRLQLSSTLSLEQAGKLLKQIGSALGYAHGQGLVHRDIKPANILVTANGDFKLSDFGIVKDLQASTDLTEGGYSLGTPIYISPEQAAGQAEPRSDLYSLGAVLYEALTGQPPFSGNPGSLLIKHATVIPTSPSLLNPDIPEAVSKVILKTLAKNPTERYTSALELINSYQKALHNESDSIEAPTIAIAVTPVITHTPNNLPIQPNRLVGREQEIAEISNLVLQPNNRLITLTGVGGTGKTRLALAVADKMLSHFKSGVYFVELDNITQRSTFIGELATVLGLREQPDKPLLETLQAALEKKDVLLVLDNFEQLVEKGATLLPELLKAAPKLTMLVSSRVALQLSAEREYPVTPLALPNKTGLQITPASLIEYAAIALFVARAQAVKSDFELTEENVVAVAEICRRLDGLPLALELAAARIRAFPVHKILERLSLKLLTGGSRDLPGRQQTLRGAIDWSYDLLSPDEQILFTRLSVFAGGCTLEAAEAVCNAANDLKIEPFEGIESLVLKSLLGQWNGIDGERHYGMLQTIREYGLEKLAESGDTENHRQHYTNYYVTLAQELEPKLNGPALLPTLKILDSEYDNLREVIFQAVNQSDSTPQTALLLGNAIWKYWQIRGFLSEGRQYLKQALTLTASNHSKKDRAIALNAAGDLSIKLGDFNVATTYLEQSLSLFREISDKRGISSSLNGLSEIALNKGEYAKAITYLEENLNLISEIKNKATIGSALATAGWFALYQRDYVTAFRQLEQSLVVFREIGDKSGIGKSLKRLGTIALEQSDYPRAIEYLEESLTISREIGDKSDIAGCLNNLANSVLVQGDFDTATVYLEQSLALFNDIGDKRGIGDALTNLGLIALEQKAYKRALGYLEQSLALSREVGDKWGIGRSLNNLGTIALEQGDYPSATKYLKEGLTCRQEIDDKWGIAYSLAGLLGLVLKSKVYKQDDSTNSTAGQADVIYLAHLAGMLKTMESVNEIVIDQQPWRGYYEDSLRIAHKLDESIFNQAFSEGQSLNLTESINYVLASVEKI